VHDLGFTLVDAWNCTLREFVMLMDNKKQRPIVLFEGSGDDNNVGDDMMANFELQRIYRGQR
jgi:hypothetical protein